MYGTISRWVKHLGRWNPKLTEADCFSVVRAVLGIDLPGVNCIADLDDGYNGGRPPPDED